MRNWSIDSLRIRIPLVFCKIIDSELNTFQHLISSTTGEILESKLNTKRFVSNTGITTTISITNELVKWNLFQLHVVILVNSKSLKQRKMGKLQTFDVNFKCCINALNNTKLSSFLPPIWCCLMPTSIPSEEREQHARASTTAVLHLQPWTLVHVHLQTIPKMKKNYLLID